MGDRQNVFVKPRPRPASFITETTELTRAKSCDCIGRWTLLTLIILLRETHGQCSGTQLVTTVGYSTASISPPGYPSGYTTNLNCEWVVTSSIAGAAILFRVTDLTTNCMGDLINVYDGTTTSGTHKHNDQCMSGSSASTLGFQSATSGNVFTTFVSDASSAASEKGFKMYMISAQDFSGTGCTSAQTLTATTTEQYLTSPSFPNSYSKNLNCDWTISSSSSSNVYIDFRFLSLEDNCGYDYVEILESGSRIAQLCHSNWEPTHVYTSTGSSFSIKFITDGFQSGERGFLLSYKETAQPTGNSATETNEDNSTKIFLAVSIPIAFIILFVLAILVCCLVYKAKHKDAKSIPGHIKGSETHHEGFPYENTNVNRIQKNVLPPISHKMSNKIQPETELPRDHSTGNSPNRLPPLSSPCSLQKVSLEE